LAVSCAALCAPGCTGDDTPPDGEASWEALLTDGDPTKIAPGSMPAAGMTPPPPPTQPRFCPGDCAASPLALWTLDDCGPARSNLDDSAFTSLPHPAFRAVSAACVPGIDGTAVKLAADEDVVYSPDQPDYVFDQGLTVAAWIKPDKITGTQSIARKRLEGSSSFVLAIDSKKLVLALKLAGGKTIGLSAGGLAAGKFTHVAATYDGRDAILYVDGAVAAKARAVGKLASSAGPILIGNDASGRLFKGVVDTIWLNTLAAPESVVKELTCVHQPPVVSLTPATTEPQIGGTTVPFDLSITNANGPNCAASDFQFFTMLPFPLSSDRFFGSVTVAPGATGHATLNVKSSKMAAIGSYPVPVQVNDPASASGFATASATYVVGTGPISCDGVAPFTPEIIGSPFAIGGAPFTYAAPGLNAPIVDQVFDPNTYRVQLQVSANPGVPTDSNNAFFGFGVGFGNPPCVDAGAFNAVRFSITGDLGTCQLSMSLTPSQNNAVDNGGFGVCTTPGGCFGPFSGPLAAGVNVVKFSDFTGGMPLATLDPTALNAIGWNLTAPSDGGVTAPCAANFTVSDVAFVTEK
jgi:hypothetical protein